jgi:Ca2+-binding RTX toxin-like protein
MLQGDDGADHLLGGPGDDLIRPGRGDDVVDAGAGADTIRAAADGRGDRIDCGPGKDTAYVDHGDRTTHCERVRHG